MYVCVCARSIVYTSYVDVQGEHLTLKKIPPIGRMVLSYSLGIKCEP